MPKAWGRITSKRGAPALLGLLAACGVGPYGKGDGPSSGARDVCSFDASSTAAALVGESSDRNETLAEARAAVAQGLPAGIEVTLTEQSATVSATHFTFAYRAAGTPLCRAEARVHRVGERLIVDRGLSPGRLDATAWAAPRLAFGSPEAALDQARGELRARTSRVTSARRCLLVEAGAPVAATEVEAWIDGRPFRIVAAGGRIRAVEPRWFEATGEARVYRSGPTDGELITVPLTDLDDGTRLRSARFTTDLAAGFALAEQADRRYVYDPSDPRFVEVSVFANAERMAAWLTRSEHAYSMGCIPIAIKPHAVFDTGGTTVNNGQYVPPEATGTGYPEIHIGDGDGRGLVNLGVDFDPVAHELGHHVLYRRLKSHYGESGVLHEGIADYLVFAATGNPCLGESICPRGSPYCAVDGQCLRSAANALTLAMPDLPLDAHTRSQVISGLLWDIGLNAPGGHAAVAATLMAAIDYLGASSGYRDFVRALMAADMELAGGAQACAILDAAVARGMRWHLDDLACAAFAFGPGG